MNLKIDKRSHSITVNNSTPFSLTDGGVVRIVYHADGVSDIVHPFSVENYEMLTAEFMDRMDSLLPLIPRDMPILLEITGCTLSERERAAINNAVRVHYRIKLAEARRELSASKKKLAVFIPCLFLSAVFLLIAQHIKNDVLLQYLYLPFWFFGYRILTYPIFDHRPLYREMERFQQLASVCISTPARVNEPLTDTYRASIAEQYKVFCARATETTLKDRLKEHVLLDCGVLGFECRVSRAEELLDPAFGEDREMLSQTLRDYLAQAEDLADPDERVRLTVDVPSISNSDAQAVHRAVLHTYTLRTMESLSEVRSNRLKTIQFALCLIIASLLLTLWGSVSGPALHEMLLIIFWFFGDYLFEFILVSRLQLSKQKHRCMNFADMTVIFNSVENSDQII